MDDERFTRKVQYSTYVQFVGSAEKVSAWEWAQPLPASTVIISQRRKH
jgi:hypothetical protein